MNLFFYAKRTWIKSGLKRNANIRPFCSLCPKGEFFFFFWELLRIMKVKSHSLCLPPKNKPKYKCSLGSSNECHPHWGCSAVNHILLETDTDLRVTSAFVHTEYKAFIPRDTTTVDCDCVVWQQVDRAQESMYVALWKDLWVTAARQSL